MRHSRSLAGPRLAVVSRCRGKDTGDGFTVNTGSTFWRAWR
jgi:hypothetical protein